MFLLITNPGLKTGVSKPASSTGALARISKWQNYEYKKQLTFKPNIGRYGRSNTGKN
jgi:hypothetical protein